MIAKKSKMLFGALLAVILIISAAAGCNFTGAKQAEITPLTESGLAYFNGDEFFNGDQFVNIRNQFLSSVYDTPQKIDLFMLFYNGSGTDEAPTEDEKAAVIAHINSVPDTPCIKISREKMDQVLTENMGITLADTEKVGLDKFTYLEKYDAYYHYHGDSNYQPKITFSSGEREGDIIRLFYDDIYYGDGQKEKVLTLQEKDGGYLFVSNKFVVK